MDAPALKAANIGMLMGERGTDVARRDGRLLVLLNDDFSSIVCCDRMGRTIFDQYQKSGGIYFCGAYSDRGNVVFASGVQSARCVFPGAYRGFWNGDLTACSVVFENEPEENNVNEPSAAPLWTRTVIRKKNQ